MADNFPLFRGNPQPQMQGLRYRFEKAGLLVEDQPIPWNADAVLVEAVVFVPSAFASRTANDFPLQIDGGQPPVFPESMAPLPRGGLRLGYRLGVPRQTAMVELFYRHRSLGQLALPVFSQAEFERRLLVEMPTVSACIGSATVACRAVVGSQCQGMIATALVRSTHFSLLPLLDLGMSVQIIGPRGDEAVYPIHFSTQQTAGKQLLIAAALPRLKRIGGWSVKWRLGDRPVADQFIRSISKPMFLRSLHVAATRFLVQSQGVLAFAPTLPKHAAEIERAGPCFLVESEILGAAGLASLRVLAQVNDAVQPPLLEDREFLISDGPNPIIPGTLQAEDLDQIEAFELHSQRGVIGRLPLRIPVAAITSEGGFQAPGDFTWSEAAEEELWQKIATLGAKK